MGFSTDTVNSQFKGNSVLRRIAMKKSLICISVLGFALLAGGAGAVAVSTAAGTAPMQKLRDTAVGRLIMGRLGRLMALRADLNLSDAQRTAVRETLQAHKKEIARAVKPVAEQKRALRDAVLAEKPDDAAIHKAADELGHRIGDAAVVLSKVKGELVNKANLTPDQMKKLGEFRSANDASLDEFFAQVEQR
jgi:Spy/CpxP family protein refolding chaperone